MKRQDIIDMCIECVPDAEAADHEALESAVNEVCDFFERKFADIRSLLDIQAKEDLCQISEAYDIADEAYGAL